MKEDKMPLISIVTPSYNQGDYIEETILSVKNQDYQPFEHIIIDGGSTDNTVEILKKYPHLKWISEPDKGQSDAINKGFRRANGEIIGWLNSDDLYEPHTLPKVVKIFNENPEYDLIYSDCHIIDAESNKTGSVKSMDFDLNILINLDNFIHQPTVFFRNKIFDVGVLDVNLHYCMDFDFWIRVSKKYTMNYIKNEIFASFRWAHGTKSVSQGDKMLNEFRYVSLKHGGKLISKKFISLYLRYNFMHYISTIYHKIRDLLR